ncbi:Ribonuclease/ribotoxin [Podospora fimiseda]|uniref:Ribonuclease/ribotoxin n=1 Tax=Podospora fimiseda TaxID=252190 RepID=A0AAN7BNJ0_9PEZI|nr:Ribonuclease/ribotoxin [Podospora fimiseda]
MSGSFFRSSVYIDLLLFSIASLFRILFAIICAVTLVTAKVTAANLTGISCGPKTYTGKQVRDATNEARRLIVLGQKLGINQYPHPFRNFESLAFATSGPYHEFPIVERGSVDTGLYTGGNPGPDRIVLDRETGIFVGAMTHTGASPSNSFVKCREMYNTTMTCKVLAATTAVVVTGEAKCLTHLGGVYAIPATICAARQSSLATWIPYVYENVLKIGEPFLGPYFTGFRPILDEVMDYWDTMAVKNWQHLDQKTRNWVKNAILSLDLCNSIPPASFKGKSSYGNGIKPPGARAQLCIC